MTEPNTTPPLPWSTRIRYDKAVQAQTLAWTKQTSPTVFVFAPSKTGKSTWISKVVAPLAVQSPEGKWSRSSAAAGLFGPVLYIDADGGSTTLGDLALDERYVKLRQPTQDPEALFAWLVAEVDKAITEPCGAIVIEAVNALYEIELGRAQRANPSAKPFDLAREPSSKVRGLFSLIRLLKEKRKFLGTGVPLFVSLNAKPAQEGDGKNTIHYYIPNMSKGLVEHCLASADALIELKRQGPNTSLRAKPTPQSPFLSIRCQTGPGIPDLAQLVSEENLDPAALLALWADHSIRYAPKRPQLPTVTNPDPNKSTDQ